MAIELITYSGSNVLPEYDASLHDALGGLTGIISGCEVTSVNNGLHIAAGDGILAGRYFKIDEEQIAVTLPASGSVASALYIHMDLTDADTPIDIIAGPVPSYAYDRTNGIYDLRLATFTAAPGGISSLTDVTPKINPKRIIQRNTAYSEGEIVLCPSAPAGVMLLCNTAGTTAAVEPVFSNANPMTSVTDGTVTWWAFTPKPPQGTFSEVSNSGSGWVDIATLQPGLYLFTAQMLFSLPSGGGSFSASVELGGTDEIAYVSGYEPDAKNSSQYIATLVSLSQAQTLSFKKYGVATQAICRWQTLKFI